MLRELTEIAMRYVITLALLLPLIPAQAAVYKCKNAAGAIDYQDRPCSGAQKAAGFNSSANNITGIDSNAARREGAGYLAAQEAKREAIRPQNSLEVLPAEAGHVPGTRSTSKIVGEGGNRGKGWEPDGDGGYIGIGGNRGKKWESDGSGGLVGAGGNRGKDWESDGLGGYTGTGGNRGAKWESDGNGGLVGTGSNRGCGWQRGANGEMVGTGCNRGKHWSGVE